MWFNRGKIWWRQYGETGGWCTSCRPTQILAQQQLYRGRIELVPATQCTAQKMLLITTNSWVGLIMLTNSATTTTCGPKKFYRYLVWFAFDCCIVNSFILWKQFQPLTNVSVHQQSLKNFRLAVANGLIGSYNSRQRYALPPQIKEASIDSCSPAKKRARTDPHQDTAGHFPVKDSRGKCVFCWHVPFPRYCERRQHHTVTRIYCGCVGTRITRMRNR